jgi:hypothetical protein
MSLTGIKDRKNPLEDLTPELGGKIVKLVADDMQRAKRASEAKRAKKAEKAAARDKSQKPG